VGEKGQCLLALINGKPLGWNILGFPVRYC